MVNIIDGVIQYAIDKKSPAALEQAYKIAKDIGDPFEGPTVQNCRVFRKNWMHPFARAPIPDRSRGFFIRNIPVRTRIINH